MECRKDFENLKYPDGTWKCAARIINDLSYLRPVLLVYLSSKQSNEQQQL